MKAYQKLLERRDYTTSYISFKSVNNFWKKLKNKTVHYCDPHDHALKKELKRYAKTYNINLQYYEIPGFVTGKKDIEKN